MRPKQAIIHNFKSIRNDLVLDIDKRITALVGASESGKTNVLEVLKSFNKEAQYEQGDFCTFCGADPAPDSQMVSIIFAVTPDEQKQLDSISPQLKGKAEVTITKCFGGQYLVDGHTYPVPPSPDTPSDIQDFLDETLQMLGDLKNTLSKSYGQREDLTSQLESVRQAVDGLETHLSQSDQFTPLRRSEGVEPFTELLNKWHSVQSSLPQLPEQTPNIEATLANLSERIEAAPTTLAHLLESPPVGMELLDIAPKFLYLHNRDLEFLEDSVAIQELETSPEKHKTMMSLLTIAGLKVQDLRIGNSTQRRRKLLRADERVSGAMRLAWLQEPISLQFDVSEDRLHVNIQGKEGHFGQLSDRSEGFRWFLSFYVNFIASRSKVENTVLLLDEPGIHIHASGQQDLLRGFEGTGKSTQVIYTTHSPYMINKNFPQRIRAVLKGGREQGTYVDNKAYRPTKGGPYEPIRSAIGLSLGNSLFLGMKNLIVEGITDHIILATVSRRFASEDVKPVLDLQEVCITLAGGSQNVPYLAYLSSHEDMKTVALLDSDSEGDKAVRRIEREGVFSKENIIQIRDAAVDKRGKTIETIEDLFDSSFYRLAIENAYRDVKSSKFTLSDLSQAGKKSGKGQANGETQTLDSDSREHNASSGERGIVKQCSALFEKNDLGDLDKVLVAKKVAEMLDDGSQLDKESQKRFQKLFKLITQKLE